MPRPIREARLRRTFALLDLYDQIRNGGDIPSIDQVVEMLNINKSDAAYIRRHIAVERCGKPVVRRKPWYWTVGIGTLPQRPDCLTPMENTVWGVLAQSAGTPMKATDIHAQLAGIPLEVADGRIARTHIARLRRKGAVIGHSFKWGYWLVLEPAEEIAS